MSSYRTRSSVAAAWEPGCFGSNPIFADLDRLFLPRRWRDWPAASELCLPASPSFDAFKADVPRFVTQSRGAVVSALTYERMVSEHGEVITRERNWHDLFNAFAWWLFPRTRRWLSAAHFDDAHAAAGGRRTRRRDALTLFDECGVVMLCTAGLALPALHAAHRWHDLFVATRSRWGRDVGALILGHGLYEQCLTPYIGLTGKALWLTVDATFFDLPLPQRYAAADRALHAHLAGSGALRTPGELLPLPVLGVPGWWPGNEHPSFYANAAYFRPPPTADRQRKKTPGL